MRRIVATVLLLSTVHACLPGAGMDGGACGCQQCPCPSYQQSYQQSYTPPQAPRYSFSQDAYPGAGYSAYQAPPVPAPPAPPIAAPPPGAYGVAAGPAPLSFAPVAPPPPAPLLPAGPMPQLVQPPPPPPAPANAYVADKQVDHFFEPEDSVTGFSHDRNGYTYNTPDAAAVPSRVVMASIDSGSASASAVAYKQSALGQGDTGLHQVRIGGGADVGGYGVPPSPPAPASFQQRVNIGQGAGASYAAPQPVQVAPASLAASHFAASRIGQGAGAGYASPELVAPGGIGAGAAPASPSIRISPSVDSGAAYTAPDIIVGQIATGNDRIGASVDPQGFSALAPATSSAESVDAGYGSAAAAAAPAPAAATQAPSAASIADTIIETAHSRDAAGYIATAPRVSSPSSHPTHSNAISQSYSAPHAVAPPPTDEEELAEYTTPVPQTRVEPATTETRVAATTRASVSNEIAASIDNSGYDFPPLEKAAVLAEAQEEAKRPFTTYINQVCSGTPLGTSHGETVQSAAEKCALLECKAANAKPTGDGRYEVVFLRSVDGRTNQQGSYCVSAPGVPVKRRLRAVKENIHSLEDTPTDAPPTESTTFTAVVPPAEDKPY